MFKELFKYFNFVVLKNKILKFKASLKSHYSYRGMEMENKKNMFSKSLTINGQIFKLHNSVKDEVLTAVERHFQKPLLNIINVFSRSCTNKAEYDVKRVTNAILRARNSSENENKAEIKVKLQDKTLKLTSLNLTSFKH